MEMKRRKVELEQVHDRKCARGMTSPGDLASLMFGHEVVGVLGIVI